MLEPYYGESLLDPECVYLSWDILLCLYGKKCFIGLKENIKEMYCTKKTKDGQKMSSTAFLNHYKKYDRENKIDFLTGGVELLWGKCTFFPVPVQGILIVAYK